MSAASSREKFAPLGPCAIDPRAFGMMFMVACAPENVVRDDGTHVVAIRGPLMHHDGIFDSYDAIGLRVLGAIEAGARAIVLSIDSPGGLVSGCFDTAAEIRALCESSRVPLFAYVDGQATSAAYALACAASRIVAPLTGVVGSIGIIAEVVDATAQAAASGVQVRLVTSGARKADGHPLGGMSDASIAAIQASVDAQAAVFFDHVASSRGLGVDVVAGLEAGTAMGASAVALGLADEVMTLEQMLAAIAGGTFGASADVAGAGATTMASKAYEEAIAALRKAAADDKDPEAAKRARRMLKAELAEDDAPPAKEPDGDEAPPAKKDDDAAAPCPPPPAKKDDEDAKAGATALAEVRAMRAEQKLAAEAAERVQLLATRPDLEPELRASLAKAPLATVRDMVATLPKRALPKPAAAVSAVGTRGEGQGDGEASRLPPAEKLALDTAMGLVDAKAETVMVGNKLTFGRTALAPTLNGRPESMRASEGVGR